MIRLFAHPEGHVDTREFNSVVSRSGWIKTPASSSTSTPSQCPAQVLSCLRDYLLKRDLTSGEIQSLKAYSSVVFKSTNGEGFAVVCFPWDAGNGYQQFGVTVSYRWKDKYGKPALVPLAKVRESLDQFTRWLEESTAACWSTSVVWEGAPGL